MKNFHLLVIILPSLLLASCEKDKPEETFDITGQTGTLSDIDGNTYNWNGIGEQAWMTENLRVTHYADGTAIPHIADHVEWYSKAHDSKAYCWYENLTENRDTYGGLYTWAAAMNGTEPSDAPYPSNLQGVCPDGWHVPSEQEWKNLEMHMGMSFQEANTDGWRGTDEGSRLKEGGTTHWVGSTGSTNETGFTALPGGSRFASGHFTELGTHAHFWSSSLENGRSIWSRELYYGNAGVYRNGTQMDDGLSVRCVRD